MHDSKNTPTKGVKEFLIAFLYHVPVIGWILRDLNSDNDNALCFLGANIVMLWALTGFLWGITGVLAGAYILLPLYALILLTIMRH